MSIEIIVYVFAVYGAYCVGGKIRKKIADWKVNRAVDKIIREKVKR